MQNKLPQYFYVWLFLAVLSAPVNFTGCCTPAKFAEDSQPKMQVLGQSTSEWDTPSEINPKSKPKRNFLAPVFTFLKRDAEEDHILVGKPISFVNSEPRSEWEVAEEKGSFENVPQHTIASPAIPQSSPISQVGYSSPIPANNAVSAKKIAALPTDSQEIVNLIAALNTHESVDLTQAETLLTELRKIDRSQIQPELYQYAIDRMRSDLIPAPKETSAEAKPAKSLPQASPPNTLKKKTSSADETSSLHSDTEKILTKNAPRIEITGDETAKTRPKAPLPGTFADSHAESTAQQSNIPQGRFSEPINDYGRPENYEPLSTQINPSGYNSRETFGKFARDDSPWVVPPPQKYSSEYAHAPQQDWEQATSFAIQALKNRVLQAPNQDAAMTDQVRLQILETALYDGHSPVGNSRYYLPGVDESVQSFVTNELFALTTLLDEKYSPEFTARLQAAQPHFQESQRQLAQSCPLRIRKMQFIQNSDPGNPLPGDFHGFGVYTPVKAEFKADDWAWVYMEMENFITSGNDAAGFCTKFNIGYEILDASGTCVKKESFSSIEETTKSPRRDMALTVPLDLEKVSPGHYRAIIQVTDQNHIRLQWDTQRIDFIVRAASETKR